MAARALALLYSLHLAFIVLSYRSNNIQPTSTCAVIDAQVGMSVVAKISDGTDLSNMGPGRTGIYQLLTNHRITFI